MVDRPPLPALVLEDGVVAGPDPPIAVHGEERCAADGRFEERVALAVQEWAERAGRASHENAVPGQCAVAAVGGRGKQVVVAVPEHDVGALVAVADRDPGVVRRTGSSGGHAGLGEVDVGGEDAAVVRAVVEDALIRDGVAEDVRVESPEVRARSAGGVETGPNDRLISEVPRTSGAVTNRHADGAVATAGV